MGKKYDYSELNKQIVLADLFEDDESILSGVAIRAKDVNAFIKAVEKMAQEQFGGATFVELLDEDTDDTVITAAIQQSDREERDKVIAAAERILHEAQ